MRKEWYIVQTYSGHEDSVEINLKRRMESMDMQDYIHRILSPEEIVVELKKDGTKKEKTKKQFPGYIFVECVITDESWFVIRNTPGVTGFLGSSGGGTKPIPLTNEEIEPILLNAGIKEAPTFEGKKGEYVNILVGPFKGQSGTVEEIYEDKFTILVLVELFGRKSPIELKYSEVSRVY